MATSIRLTGFSKKDGSQLLCIEPCWWVIGELNQNVKMNWVESNDTGSYRDDDADISVEEARTLHEQFKPYAFQGIYSLPDTHHFIKPDLDAIELAVGKGANEFAHFHVCVFEWDSGY